MNETFVTIPDAMTARTELDWQDPLDALVVSHCAETLGEDITYLRDSSPSTDADIAALRDQRYRRGEIPAGLFRPVESNAPRDMDTFDEGMTADLPHFATATLGSAERAPRPPAAFRMPLITDSDAVQVTAAEVQAEIRAPLPPMEIGRVLRDRYVLESRLGCGGMGTVFKALDRFRCDLPETDQHVAIKILHEDIASRPEVLTNLRREFYCAQTLSHKNIVRVYELDRDEHVAFFTMEFLDGKTLRDVMEQFHPLPVTRQYAWPIIRDIGAGLAHAHARKVIHADLKPQNIFITNSGEVRLLDFGTSSTPARRHASSGRPKAAPTALTPAYASCELLDGQPADPRDDLYALSCLSYALLAGEHPFQNKRSNEARNLGMTPRRPPGLTNRQWRALSQGLSWERKNRSITVRDWIAELNPRLSLVGWLVSNRDVSADVPKRALPFLGVALLLVMAWGLIHRTTQAPARPHGHEAADAAPVAVVARPATVTNSNAPATQIAPAAVKEPAAVAVQEVPSNDASPLSLQPPAIPKVSLPLKTRAAQRRQSINTIAIGASSKAIRVGENFAEIRVQRSFGFDDDATFDWWTESASARPGLDYVAQSRTTTVFSKGRRAASIFVRLVPNPARKIPAVFYVVIGNPSKGNSLGSIARTAIELPPS